MTSQAGYFEPSKSSHITLFPSSNQRLKSELTTEAGFICEAHSSAPEQDAKLAKIRDSDLLNEVNNLGSDDIYSSSRYFFALNGANLG